MPAQKVAACWKFASAQLDERTLELTVAGEIVDLERKPLEVLRHLLQRSGEVVTHAELLEAVWPGRILSESVLKKCVSRVREALRDDDHAIIKTVHGYGYRLLAPVEVTQPQATLLLSPKFAMHSESEVRNGAVLVVDIAGTVAMRSLIGDSAAGRRIRHLLEAIVEDAREHGGEFIKSYGDDVLAVFEHEPVAMAAQVAIRAQQLAAEAGLRLYAGLHAGEVEFRQAMGHPDALGLTVNFAARLHKLTEGAPGRIFLAEESVHELPPPLRALATRFGTRDVRGIGPVSIWTLDWLSSDRTTDTVVTHEPAQAPIRADLVLAHGAQQLRLDALHGSAVVGRGAECQLRLPDPESKISSTHLLFEFGAGRWFVQDVSRNGTWLRDAATGEESTLPYCKQALLPRSGALCLGRPLADDADGRFTLAFHLDEH